MVSGEFLRFQPVMVIMVDTMVIMVDTMVIMVVTMVSGGELGFQPAPPVTEVSDSFQLLLPIAGIRESGDSGRESPCILGEPQGKSSLLSLLPTPSSQESQHHSISRVRGDPLLRGP